MSTSLVNTDSCKIHMSVILYANHAMMMLHDIDMYMFICILVQYQQYLYYNYLNLFS